MLRIVGSLAILATILAGGVYFYASDADGSKFDQTCIAEAREEP